MAQSGISRRTFVAAAPLALAGVAGLCGMSGCSEAEKSETVYALLYDSGTLVFQMGDVSQPDAYGKLIDTFTGFDGDLGDESYTFPDSVTRATFNCTVTPASTSYWFANCVNLKTLQYPQNLDTSNVTDMSYMFYNCSTLDSVDASTWDTGSVTDMQAMFCRCSALTTLDTAGWDTSNVTDMSHMFEDCISLTSLDLSSWNTSSDPDTTDMYKGCTSLMSVETSDPDLALDKPDAAE